MIDKKELENMEYFNCLGGTIKKDIRCTRKFNPGLPWQKQHSAIRRLFLPAL
jgi:hypothetical protein